MDGHSDIRHGGCLCGAIRFEAVGQPGNPHACSCESCRRHTGAPSVGWVEYPRSMLRWTGPGGAPAVYRSSDYSSRAFCPHCGSSLGAIDDAPTVALLIGADEHRDPIAARRPFLRGWATVLVAGCRGTGGLSPAVSGSRMCQPSTWSYSANGASA